MPVTEFDDSAHYGLFLTNPNRLDSSTVMRVRMSELTLAALRAAGVFDNMIDGTSAPATDKLWLDKNFDPAVLKEWDATGASWVPMTFDRLFGRAAVGQLTVTGGTGNAVVVSEPSGFKADRLYLITPTADNTTAVTIQVAGVGTYPVKYGDGSDLLAGEFATGRQSVLLFDGLKFVVAFSIAGLNAYVADAAASASAASTSASNAAGSASAASGSASAAATSATNAANAATAVLTGATSDDTFADTDQFVYLSSTTVKKGTLTGLLASIFATARKIANAQFLTNTLKLFNTAGTFSTRINNEAYGADRIVTLPDRDITLGMTLVNTGTLAGTAANDFAVPAGVRRIVLLLGGFSTNGTSIPMIQLMAGGVAETSGYSGAASNTALSTGLANTAGFYLNIGNSAATSYDLVIEVILRAGNTWTAAVQGSSSLTVNVHSSGGKTLAGALSGLRLVMANGTDIPDVGGYTYYVEY